MKKSHVRFFHGKASQKNFSREIFSRGAAPEKFRPMRLSCSLAHTLPLPSIGRGRDGGCNINKGKRQDSPIVIIEEVGQGMVPLPHSYLLYFSISYLT